LQKDATKNASKVQLFRNEVTIYSSRHILRPLIIDIFSLQALTMIKSIL
jgi:hypothetical protein